MAEILGDVHSDPCKNEHKACSMPKIFVPTQAKVMVSTCWFLWLWQAFHVNRWRGPGGTFCKKNAMSFSFPEAASVSMIVACRPHLARNVIYCGWFRSDVYMFFADVDNTTTGGKRNS